MLSALIALFIFFQGTTVGFEIVKYLGCILETLLREHIKDNLPVSIRVEKECENEASTYVPIIVDISFSEIFKAYTHPKDSDMAHLTNKVRSLISEINKPSHSSCRYSRTPKRYNKKNKRKKSPCMIPVELDSEEELERMKRRYIRYKKSLQSCECFHPETILRLKKSYESGSNPAYNRPTSLFLEDVINIILSLMVQYTLYDPLAFDETSWKCAQYSITLSSQMLTKLIDEQSLNNTYKFKLIKKFTHYLFKLFLSGCNKICSFLPEKFDINIPQQFLHLIQLFVKISKEESFTKYSDWFGDILGDIVLGITSLLIALSCGRDVHNAPIESKNFFSIHNFLSKQYILALKEIYVMLIHFKSEKLLVIIQSFAKVILYVKVEKEKQIHKSDCSKSVHTNCDFSMPYLLHHSKCFSSSESSDNCVVSSIVRWLLFCFKESRYNDICFAILEALSKSGFCCCMSLSSILPFLLEDLELRNEKLQYAIVSFIETIVWKALNGINGYNKNLCQFCDKQVIEKAIEAMHYQESRNEDCDNKWMLHENSVSGHSHWEGLSIYNQYIFSEAVGPLLAEHLTRLILLSKWEIKKEICDQIIIKCLETLIHNKFRALQSDEPSVITSVINSILKCLRLCYEYLECENLLSLLFDEGIEIIDHCKRNPNTRYETYHLLCTAVDKEQKSIRVSCEDEHVEMFSNYFLTELRRFEIFWRRRFDNSSRFVRGKANIDSLPSHHSFETSWNLGNFILSDTDTQCSEDLNSRNENEKQTSHKCETSEGSEVQRRENNSRVFYLFFNRIHFTFNVNIQVFSMTQCFV